MKENKFKTPKKKQASGTMQKRYFNQVNEEVLSG